MSKYLDETGLSHLWDKIKAYVAAHSGGGGSTVNFMQRGLSTNTTVSIGSTWTYANVPLNTTLASNGSVIEASGNGIKVNETGYYRISATLVANAPVYAKVYAGGTTVGISSVQNGTAYTGSGLGSTVRYLTAGTIVYLKVCKTSSTDPSVAGADLTSLTVEKVVSSEGTSGNWTTLNGVIKYRIKSGFCTVYGNSGAGGTTVGTSGTVVGTLPSAARPSVEIQGAASTKANADGQWLIGTDGTIKVWNLSGNSYYWAFTITYPLG